MSGGTALLVKLGARLVVFTLVFWLAAKRNDRIVFARRWVPPLVGAVFAVLNTALYWALTPILDVATLGSIAFAMPLVVNAVLLALTVRVFRSRRASAIAKPGAKAGAKGAVVEPPLPWFHVDGFFAMMWMAIYLTLAHGVLWIALDYIPKHV